MNCSYYIKQALDSPFEIIRFNEGYYYIDDTITIEKIKCIELAGGYTQAIKACKPGHTYIHKRPNGTVLWTDVDIDIFDVKIIPDEIVRWDNVPMVLPIHGGTIDVSPMLTYSKVAVHIFRRHDVRLRINFHLNIIGPNKEYLVNGEYILQPNTSTGTAIALDEDDYESEWGTNNGVFGGGYVTGYIERFHTGVKHANNIGPKITNMSYNLGIDVCKYAYDFGEVGNGGGAVEGWVQCGKYWLTPYNGEAVIIGNIDNCYINCHVFDVNDSDLKTNQYTAIISSPSKRALLLRFGERIKRNSIGGAVGELEKFDSWGHPIPNRIEGYVADIPNYVKILDNNLLHCAFETVANDVTVNASSAPYDEFWGSGIYYKQILSEDATLTVFTSGSSFPVNAGRIINLYVIQHLVASGNYFKTITVYGYDHNNVDKNGLYNGNAVTPTVTLTDEIAVTNAITDRPCKFKIDGTLGVKTLRIVFSNPEINNVYPTPVDPDNPTEVETAAINAFNAADVNICIKGEAQTSNAIDTHLFKQSSVTIPAGKLLTVNGIERVYGNMFTQNGSKLYINGACEIANNGTGSLSIGGSPRLNGTYFRYNTSATRWECGGSSTRMNTNGIFVKDINHPDIGDTATRTGSLPTTASSADDKAKYAGYMYFDTDMHKWVVWDGTQWTDMCGNALT